MGGQGVAAPTLRQEAAVMTLSEHGPYADFVIGSTIRCRDRSRSRPRGSNCKIARSGQIMIRFGVGPLQSGKSLRTTAVPTRKRIFRPWVFRQPTSRRCWRCIS